MKTALIIDNEHVAAGDDATYSLLGATSGQEVTVAAAAAVGDAIKAADAAARAFIGWSLTGPTERRRILLKAADVLESKTAEFISVMEQEVGASPLWSGFNVMLAANLFRE
ncbi:MAG: acyl-CoA reductase family protein, partial [Polaromonas sp.]|nr:acyl-CoA reductase family protein [Polaromonas sp.]